MASWKVVEVIPFRRAGRWLVGALVQEDEEGRRRVKVFKGRIKEDGKYVAHYHGKEIRFSLVQRLNIPSAKYWEYIKEHVDAVVREHLQERREDGRTLFDF